MEVGIPITPCDLVHFDFSMDAGPWTSARNADWYSATSYTTWVPAEGGESAHLLLGDGVTEGAGMAMASAFPVAGGSTVRISWLHFTDLAKDDSL